MLKNTAHIIVFGNEKGGSGKSTSAMHVAIALLRLGYRVGTIDLDTRQGTLTRYLKKRFEYITKNMEYLPSPAHMPIDKSSKDSISEQQAEEESFLTMAMDDLNHVCDFIVIDTPGTDSFLSRLAHSYADTLITPINDSFIDLDLLADININNHDIIGPSVYSKMVNDQRKIKKKRDGSVIDWIVMRNRMPHLSTNDNKIIADILGRISGLADFRLAYGFGERVAFKEMFPKGLTLSDLKEDKNNKLTLSQIAARQEVRNLIMEIAPEKIKGYIEPLKSKKTDQKVA